MRSKEDLFQLIQAMSKSEKRYFVLDAKKSGRASSRYLSLFEAINNMEGYDEAPLKEKFAINLSSDKAYLYEAILRSMRDYRSQSSKAAQVKERLMDARYLYERGLYHLAGDRITEAKMFALELKDNFALLEIIREEFLSLYDRRVRVNYEQLEALNKEKEAALEGVVEELQYIELYFKLVIEFYKSGILKTPESIKELEERIPMDLLKESSRPASPLALRRYYLCKASYNRLVSDTMATYQNYQKAVDWWKNYPAVKEEEFFRFVSDANNLVNTCYTEESLHPVANEWFDRLKNEDAGKTYHEKKYVFMTLSLSNLLHQMNLGNKEATKRLLPDLIDGLDKFALKKSVPLLANIVTAFFWVGDHANCLKWADQFIALKNNSREDIQRIMMIYKLVALFELGKVDETEAWLRSANRYFNKQKLPAESFENEMLNVYLKRIINAPINELKVEYAATKAYLEGAEQKFENENLLGLGELQAWINQKVKAR